MQNPFEDNDNFRETDTFLSTFQKKHNISYYKYIFVSLVFLLEIFTATFGGISNDSNTGLFNTNLNLQHWLITSGIYGIIGIIFDYQFNQKVYKNKIYFIFYDLVKICWILIGNVILFGFNRLKDCNTLIGYSLFYIIFNILYISYTFSKTLRLKNILN